MELRRSTHFHFIQAIRGGSVTKSMNVGSRGRPALKFKEIKDVYGSSDSVYHNQVPRFCPRDDLESSPTKCSVVGVESPDSSFMKGIKIQGEAEDSDFNCNSHGGERNNDLDDLGFGDLMLKQFKKRCKTKKRKRFNSAGSNKEITETFSTISPEFTNVQLNGDDSDLEEPLISWTSKLSKNMKSKRKSLRKSVSVLSPKIKSIIKSELFKSDEDLLQPSPDRPPPLDVKVEVPGACYSECQTIFPVVSVSDFSCSEQDDSTVIEYNDVPETTNVPTLETVEPYPTKETEFCSLNEVSYEYMSNFEPKSDADVSGWEIVEVDCPEVISCDYSELSGEDHIIHLLSYDVSSGLMSPYISDVHDSCQSKSLIQVPETTPACCLETDVSFYPIECCASNGVSYDSMEEVDPKFSARFSGWEIVKVDSPKIIGHKCFEKESYTICPLVHDVSSESTSLPKDHCTDLHDSFKDNSSDHKMALRTSNYGHIEVPEMDISNLQCLENISEGSSFSDNGLDWSSSCLNTERHSDPASGDSPSPGKQSLLPASVATNDFDASGKPMASSGSPNKGESTDEGHHQMVHHHGPERILSSRKAISPTSQERLCRAMESTVDENERHPCRGKLYFGKQTNHRILKAQGLDQFWRDGVTLKPKPAMTKARQDKKGSPPKGILKVIHPSRSVEPVRRVSGACTTSQCCSQSVIAFTQQQMRDTESLAMKLEKELKSMKDIVKRKLQPGSEASVVTSTKENPDEVRIAIEKATRAEETARKFLSMMARDCNRFCKIMSQRLTEDNYAASERVMPKERKLTFADEAGGKLCHVKVFKDDIGTASLVECESKTEIAV